MPESSPWDGIAVPGADFNVRQVAGEMAVPCFWGRDTGGACLFIIELQGDHTAQYRKNIVSVNGIEVDLRAGIPGQQRLVLTLEKQVDRDLFEGHEAGGAPPLAIRTRSPPPPRRTGFGPDVRQ